jgi:hypothetical protein
MKFSSKELKPGQTGTIRIKYNPNRKGPFIEKVPVYFSSKPEAVVLTITGNVKYLDPNEDVICPNFQMTTEEKEVRQPFTVMVVDKTSQQPIPGASVVYDPAPAIRKNIFTGADGTTRTIVPIGIYHLQASAKGYSQDQQDVYISKTLATTTLYLDRLPGYVPPRDSVMVVQGQTEEIHEKPGELPLSDFGPNNIVFLIDVSSSMAYPEKLPLLKIAMKNLLYTMRGIDRISIVTYAGNTDVVLESTPADKKDKIEGKINGLKSGGSTEGGKGIREAYRIAEKHFISGGNNMIILATDGDFNLDKSDDALFGFIQEQTARGISLSVMGFGNKERAVDKMQKIATTGQGSFMHIQTKEEAGPSLVEEIKQRSRRQ